MALCTAWAPDQFQIIEKSEAAQMPDMVFCPRRCHEVGTAGKDRLPESDFTWEETSP